MNYAKDDMIIAKDLAALSVNIAELQKSTSTPRKKTVEDVKDQEIFELSESFVEKVKNLKDPLIDSQRGLNAIQVAQNGLAQIEDSLVHVNSLAKKASNEQLSQDEYEELNLKIQNSMSNIDDIVEETEFEGKKILKGELKDIIQVKAEETDINISSQLTDASASALGMPEDTDINSQESAQKLSEQAQQAIAETQAKQEDLNIESEKIIKTVDANIELDSGVSSISYNIDGSSGEIEEIKDNVIKEISQNPDRSVKVQIHSLNDKMILAMMSLSRG